ncbi:hypothetical protein RISK_001430 [Rhodopirellula islandica]|uniref:Uncharacterized protein n=1 Tax=Rhodopirellula islandica TaxID=595434 RepID=A0A0J1EKY6_RHOIS|nr:hypothetical protein RISK_001430 [Rhodopirellula islandica]
MFVEQFIIFGLVPLQQATVEYDRACPGESDDSRDKPGTGAIGHRGDRSARRPGKHVAVAKWLPVHQVAYFAACKNVFHDA